MIPRCKITFTLMAALGLTACISHEDINASFANWTGNTVEKIKKCNKARPADSTGRTAGSHKNRVAIFMGPVGRRNAITVFEMFNYICALTQLLPLWRGFL